MELEITVLQEIAYEYFDIDDKDKYDKDWKEFIHCYEIIRNIERVNAGYDINLQDCMYYIASDIATNDFFETTTDSYGNVFNNYAEKYKSPEVIIHDALYRTYGYKCSPEYLKKLILKQETNN